MAWTNDDGLLVKFGVEETEKARVTEYCTYGPERLVEIVVDFEQLPAVADGSILLDVGYTIPEGARIDAVEVIQNTLFDSAADTATLNIGLADADGGSDITDVDALVAAITAAEITAGGENVAAWAGAAVGTVLSEAAKITWEVDTEAFTAGEGVIRVRWSVPKVDDDTLVWAKS